MEFIRKRVLQLSRIPKDLDSVTSIDRDREVDPRDVGMSRADVDGIWDQVLKLYRTGTHPAITVSLRRQGKTLLSRGIGHARGNGPYDDPEEEKVLATADTPICLYSTSKGITALLMRMLAIEAIAGNEELLGPDVTTAHRMLKNDVVAATGWSEAEIEAKMPEIIVLCHSPVQADDPAACGDRRTSTRSSLSLPSASIGVLAWATT